MRVAIITISDTVSRGGREDLSGAAVEGRCRELGWELVCKKVLPDELDAIRDLLVRLGDSGSVDLILTTGGTGLGPRDVTPEATAAAAERMVPSLGERIRLVTGRNFPRAYLSRSAAGIRGKTLILNLPGSPGGAVESLDAVTDLLPHAVAIVNGAGH